MRRYFMRQMSIRWFDAYLIVSGVALNVLAVYSFATLLHGATPKSNAIARVRVELEDARICTQHMGGREFKGAEAVEVPIRLLDGREIPVQLKGQRLYGITRYGNALEMVRVAYSQADGEWSWLFFEVSPAKKILRCIQSGSTSIARSFELDCLAASGDFLDTGTCRLPVNLPSDCETMRGMLVEKMCVVPRDGKILRASSGSATRRVCVAPDCE